MTAFAKRHWVLFLLAGMVVAALLRAAHLERRLVEMSSTRVVDLQKEVAAAHIPEIQAKAKATRRADRERVDQEVQRAAGDSDLVGYLGSRSR